MTAASTVFLHEVRRIVVEAIKKVGGRVYLPDAD
jgi:hypothetical protein